MSAAISTPARAAGGRPRPLAALAAHRTRIGRELLILAAYLAFAVYATYPLVKWMFTKTEAIGDPFVSAWGLWWTQHQLFHLHNPWVTDHLFAPAGSQLAYDAFVPVAGVVLAPVTALLGPALTLNLTRLALPVLASYIAYRCALRLGLARWAAVLAGGIYGFSPVLVWRDEYHFNFAVGALFAPAALLCAIRWRQRRTLADAALLGAVVGLAALADQTSALLAVFAVGPYLVVATLLDREPPRRWWRAAVVAGAATLLFAAPQLWMTHKANQVDASVSDPAQLAPSWTGYDTSVRALLSPSPAIRVGSAGFKGQLYDHEIGEGWPTLGWGVLALALLGVALAPRQRWAVGLAAMLLGLFVLALGPEVTWNHHPAVPFAVVHHGQRVSAIMPYTWMVELPGFSNLRVSTRFGLLAVLPAALLAGFALAGLVARRRWWTLAPAAILLTLVVLEAGHPMGRHERFVPFTRPDVYGPITAQKSNSIVLDVPFGWLGGNQLLGTTDLSEGMLRATEHGHRVGEGFVSRLASNRLATLRTHQFYTDVLQLQQSEAPVNPYGFPTVNPIAGGYDAGAMNLEWVVLYPGTSRALRSYLVAAGFAKQRTNRDGIETWRRVSVPPAPRR